MQFVLSSFIKNEAKQSEANGLAISLFVWLVGWLVVCVYCEIEELDLVCKCICVCVLCMVKFLCIFACLINHLPRRNSDRRDKYYLLKIWIKLYNIVMYKVVRQHNGPRQPFYIISKIDYILKYISPIHFL